MKKSNLKFSAAAVLPAGFRAAGIVAGLKKSRKPDMALFFSDSPAVLAGTFTTNQVKAATVRLDAERVAKIKKAIEAAKEAAKEKKARILGTYGCSGYDTFGPFKLVGGLKKGHPDAKEIGEAVQFYRSLPGKA